MKRVLFSIFLILFFGSMIAFSGCTDKQPGNPSQVSATTTLHGSPTGTQTSTPINIDSSKSVVDANNRFAFDLFKKLNNDPAHSGKNVFFSPFGISSAMAITYEGARGRTADEILSVSHLPTDSGIRRYEYSQIFTNLNREDANCSIRVANALWAEKSYAFLPEYIRMTEQYYSANATNLDLMNNPEGSRTTINNWVDGTVTIFAETPITKKPEKIGEEARCQNYSRENKRETG